MVALLGGAVRWYRQLLLVVVPIVALSFAPVLVAVPIREYEIGWFGALATIWIFTVGALVVLVYKGLVSLSGRLRSRTLDRRAAARTVNRARSRSQWAAASCSSSLPSPLTAWAEPVRESFFESGVRHR